MKNDKGLKQITMDFGVYEDEIAHAGHRGRVEGRRRIIEVMKNIRIHNFGEAMTILLEEFEDDEPGFQKVVDALGVRVDFEKIWNNK